MKRILVLLPLLSLIVISCNREPFADAVFLSNSPYCTSDFISIESLSSNSEYVEWDMGDGTTYNTHRIDHMYTLPGNYEIRLMAYGKSGGIDVASYFTEVLDCTPVVDGSISLNPAYVGEYITFTDLSINAEYVEWDMGDGFSYNDPVVNHYFVDPGWYDVKLSAYGSGGEVDQVILPVEVIGAELTVIVRLWTDTGNGEEPGYLLPGASVRLYPTLTDWENETNMKAEAFSDSFGECTFSNLSYQNYYVDVWEANHDNYTLAAEDVGWIVTPMLEGAFYWTFEAMVDYYPDAKKSSASCERPQKTLKAAPSGEKRTPGETVKKVKRERK